MYRKALFAIIAILSTYTVDGQSAKFTWPIHEAKMGKGIISAPQSYVGNELNESDLFISAKAGTTIVSPVSGVIDRVAIGYLHSLVVSTSFAYEASFDESISKIDKDFDQKYLHGFLVIRTEDGSKVQIRGLRGDKQFNVGERIESGSPLGVIGYSYYKIEEPSIHVSVSDGVPLDPMTPFGLRTTFIAPRANKIAPIPTLTKEQAKEDFIYYIDAIRELYAGLPNLLTQNEVDRYVADVIASIDSNNKDITFADFLKIMRRSMAKIHDSHIALFEPQWKKSKETEYFPQIRFGWIGDKLVCTNATAPYEQYIGKEIVSINSFSADSIKTIITSRITSFDAQVEGYPNFICATTGFLLFFDQDSNYDMAVEFADGEKKNFVGGNSKNRGKYVGNWFDFSRINFNKTGYCDSILNDSTAYLGISTFVNISKSAIEEIESFISSLSDNHNFIIDLRNNSGGNDDVVSKLFSYIAQDTLALDGYYRVNKRGGFQTTLMNSYVAEDDFFQDFSPVKGKEGYYQYQKSIYVPSSTVNFKGKVYVLINENTMLGASQFAALVVRSHRGVVVGREGGSSYHYKNALRFGDIRLPNSTLMITIPLVEMVSDTVVNERMPWGRGVLPDYYVPLTLDELNSKNGDAILNQTLLLIKEGRYLSNNNPSSAQEEQQENSKENRWNFVVIALVLVGLIVLWIIMRRVQI